MDFKEKLDELFKEHDKKIRESAFEELLAAIKNHYKIYRCVPSIAFLEEIVKKLEEK